ncbi:hypothetical protein Y1Q_0024340 [Alligator mississippiensis]|uniref:Uncharacterized protein n=1 Tax=Alligator mississippiensis TaxID=8496 RepID=A0A151NIM8_ALLMI|nr:hypothetical protein Y1Q_0024340 [Alligator mississippiensis]
MRIQQMTRALICAVHSRLIPVTSHRKPHGQMQDGHKVGCFYHKEAADPWPCSDGHFIRTYVGSMVF